MNIVRSGILIVVITICNFKYHRESFAFWYHTRLLLLLLLPLLLPPLLLLLPSLLLATTTTYLYCYYYHYYYYNHYYSYHYYYYHAGYQRVAKEELSMQSNTPVRAIPRSDRGPGRSVLQRRPGTKNPETTTERGIAGSRGTDAGHGIKRFRCTLVRRPLSPPLS